MSNFWKISYIHSKSGIHIGGACALWIWEMGCSGGGRSPPRKKSRFYFFKLENLSYLGSIYPWVFIKRPSVYGIFLLWDDKVLYPLIYTEDSMKIEFEHTKYQNSKQKWRLKTRRGGRETFSPSPATSQLSFASRIIVIFWEFMKVSLVE